jgi:hypothetical protein
MKRVRVFVVCVLGSTRALTKGLNFEGDDMTVAVCPVITVRCQNSGNFLIAHRTTSECTDCGTRLTRALPM